MKSLLYASSLVVVGFAWHQMECSVVAQEQDKPVPVVTAAQSMSFWMEKKLEYSKKILEALTSGKHQEIESNAEQMRLLGKIEGFVRRQSPSYSSHLQSFDLATRELTRQARDKNIEGATLAFHQLTTSCVACHRSIREVSPTEESPVTSKPARVGTDEASNANK